MFALPTFATNAGRAVSGDTSGALFEHAFNVPVGVVVHASARRWRSSRRSSRRTATCPTRSNADFGWSIGIKRDIGGHWFEILLTNSQATTVDQYVTSTFQGCRARRGRRASWGSTSSGGSAGDGDQ